jgi:DNA repair exonuclease SbcCD nuclease subunit
LAGPRGIAFLIKQFARLAEHQIPVYWAGGRLDRPERWPAALHLPDNVLRFSSQRPEDFVFEGGNGQRARVTGISRPRGGKVRAADFWPDADGWPSIAVAHGKADRASLAERDITYWALGGKHRRANLFDAPHAAHYSGTPQSRRQTEAGACGCTLVEIDESGKVHTRPIATDVVRWQTHRVAVSNAVTADSLEGMLIEQTYELRSAILDRHLILSWTVHGSGPLVALLRREKPANEILSRLRRHFEHEHPAVWIHSLEVETDSAVPPRFLEQDSLLGDYLRALTEFDSEAAGADLVGPLERLVARHHVEQFGAGAEHDEDVEYPATTTPRQKPLACLRFSDDQRRGVLQKAAVLGAGLLSGEEVKP